MLKKLGEFVKIIIVAGISLFIISIVLTKTGLLSSISTTFNPSRWLETDSVGSNTNSKQTVVAPTYNALTFNQAYQFKMSDLDQLKRAGIAHIQLQNKDMQTDVKRPSLIEVDPVGWHNYKIDGDWLMNRGHLVGYQFCKINDDLRNLVPETAYLNTGTIKGDIDATNSKSMIYYEQKLAKWLRNNPSDWLDYQVTPIYDGDDLVPKQIKLNYIGLDSNGKKISITLGGKEKKTENGSSEVVLENSSPNAVLNYRTGQVEK